MKNTFIVLISFIVVSCSTSNQTTKNKCQSILKNDYNNILVEQLKSNFDNETILLNEVRYECVHTAMYTKKGMYDRFGKWNREVYLKGKKYPALLWENVRLFPNDTTEFIVVANGLESYKHIYASVFVFDKQNNDLLSEESEYKTKLIYYFSDMIKSNNLEIKEFYEIYWKIADLEHWNRIKDYQ